MEAILILFFIYGLLYAYYIFRLIYGFSKITSSQNRNSDPKTAFSIVIPFRNESKNLPILLKSLSNLDYPATLIEYIFVDDFSTDDSAKIINRWRLENDSVHTTMLDNVRISKSPKKDAINRAIPIVMHSWIITTDADCTFLPTWLSAINDFVLHNNVEMIAGPVLYKNSLNPLHQFQQTDFLALQGATIGGFGLQKAFMGNAANFAFTKNLFHEVGGFSGNDHVASGDDVFLLQKAFARFPQKVKYLKSENAIVSTQPASGFLNLFFQRVRWASKASSYDHEFAEMLAIVVFIGNAVLCGAFILTLADKMDYQVLIGLFLLKFIPDYILVLKANAFLRKGRFTFPILSGIIYPFFAVSVGLYSLYGKYSWKGRTLN